MVRGCGVLVCGVCCVMQSFGTCYCVLSCVIACWCSLINNDAYVCVSLRGVVYRCGVCVIVRWCMSWCVGVS